MGYYMLKNGFWNGDATSIEPNGEIEKYNAIRLKTENDKVVLGGKQ